MRWNGNSSAGAQSEAFADDAQQREDARALDSIGEVLTALVIGFILGACVAGMCMAILRWPPV